MRDWNSCGTATSATWSSLDAVNRPLAPVSANVDKGNIVVFGSDESYIENTSTGHRMPVSMKKNVSGAVGHTSGFGFSTCVRLDEPQTNERTLVFQAASVNQQVEDIREHLKTKTENEARKEVCVTRIEEVDDVEVTGTEPGGRAILWRQEEYAKTRSSTPKRTGNN